MALTNMTRIEQILADPDPEANLDTLKSELNELSKLRDLSRVAFCKRLAVVYLILVGRPMSQEGPKDGASKKFYEWCWRNLRTANGKNFSTTTLRKYTNVGFSANPALVLKTQRVQSNHRSELMRRVGCGLASAVTSPPKVVTITCLKEKFKLPTNVAQEVNTLMRAWEEASEEARSQFIYMVTGRKVSAA